MASKCQPRPLAPQTISLEGPTSSFGGLDPLSYATCRECQLRDSNNLDDPLLCRQEGKLSLTSSPISNRSNKLNKEIHGERTIPESQTPKTKSSFIESRSSSSHIPGIVD
ncbi:hypothetical protein HPP92_011683 [Vanilla planifolia]|uniref:Uncharacterized protein n=1 Tax=Vanilla planifolia TaxID=51239 RepID=A0A835R7G0_VANPL|nr:hypothetical protein HPP92_011683 [Vanilla planifolia]